MQSTSPASIMFLRISPSPPLLLDNEPAQALAEKVGLKVLLVTESTAAAGKAIAIPNGETAFKAELDKILQGLADDGTIQKIQEANGLP